MQQTKKLYDDNAYCREFTAEVLVITSTDNGDNVVLSATAFFPEEGGQSCDTGTLGGYPVAHVSLDPNGVITHTLSGNTTLKVGDTVTGLLDFAPRYRKMQHHTGEHLLSGLAHRLFGAENVGFHLGEDDVTMDLDLPLDRYALDQIETLANEAVWKNLPITAVYPDPELLPTLSYRSKLDLKENVRIVTIEDYDDCACCAPHVAMTGEIGMIKILNYMNYKGGVRLHIVCGGDALKDYRSRYASILEISNLLSVKQDEVVSGVKQLQNALVDAKRSENALRNRILDETIKSLPVDITEENLLVFAPLLEARQLREFVNCGVTRTSGIFAAFSGNDDDGYNFILGAKAIDLRPFVKEMNLVLNGRGGGSKEMVQGAIKCKEADIRAFFAQKQ